MIQLQNPNIPTQIDAVEIDKAILELQLALDTNLDWLTNSYARAYRHLDNNDGNKLYFPEVYQGNNDYHRVTPDNDKKGMCFFVVGQEDNDFEINQFNYLKWNVGIVFWVNLELINKPLLTTSIFTQNLIKDVRDVLTRKLGGLDLGLKIKTVQREFNEVYKEFSIEEKEGYLKAPYSAFRFNCELSVMESNCDGIAYNPAEALRQNVSQNEILNILLPTLDFSDDSIFNSLSVQQKTDLLSKLQP